MYNSVTDRFDLSYLHCVTMTDKLLYNLSRDMSLIAQIRPVSDLKPQTKEHKDTPKKTAAKKREITTKPTVKKSKAKGAAK